MGRIIIMTVVISIIFIAAIWEPTLYSRIFPSAKTKVIDFNAQPRYKLNMDSDHADVKAVDQADSKSKTNWKVIITWLIGSLNGILLILTQIQKVFGHAGK